MVGDETLSTKDKLSIQEKLEMWKNKPISEVRETLRTEKRPETPLSPHPPLCSLLRLTASCDDPQVPDETCERFGPSYRRLPAQYQLPECKVGDGGRPRSEIHRLCSPCPTFARTSGLDNTAPSSPPLDPGGVHSFNSISADTTRSAVL